MSRAGWLVVAAAVLLAAAADAQMTTPTPPGTAVVNTTNGPGNSAPGNLGTASGPATPTAAPAKAPAAAPAATPIPGPAAAPGSPAPQPAGYPQVTVPYDTRLPEASEDLPISGPLAPAPANTPEQFHLAYSNDGGMYVSWASGPSVTTVGAVSLPNVLCTTSMVKYGTSTSALTQTAVGSATGYTQLYQQLYGVEANYSSPYLHHVKLANLTPNTTYFYTVGDGTAAGTSGVMNFTSAPAVGTLGFRLIMFADLGQTYNSSSTLSHIAYSLQSAPSYNAAPHFVYAADYSYADDYLPNGTITDDIPSTTKHLSLESYQPREDSFARFISPLTQSIPFMGSQGNHEIQLQSNNQTNFAAWLARWVYPWRESNSPSPFFYSYNYGGAHIIALSNYVWPNYKYNGQQYQWLAADLAAVNRTLTPWVIVQFHNPWYSTNSYGDFKQMDCFRQVLEPLLYKYGVDIIYNGHVHSYERFYPVNDWQINECGMTSIVIGDGGNSEGLTINYVEAAGNCVSLSKGAYYFQDICPFDAPGYSGAEFPGGNVTGFCPPTNFQASPSAYREDSFGHGTLDVINATTAFWQWHRNQNGTAMVADSYYITRNTQRCPSKAGVVSSGPAPQPVISSVPSYYSSTCGTACNNYTGFPVGYGTSVDASGSQNIATSNTKCPATGSGPAAAPAKAPTAAAPSTPAAKAPAASPAKAPAASPVSAPAISVAG